MLQVGFKIQLPQSVTVKYEILQVLIITGEIQHSQIKNWLTTSVETWKITHCTTRNTYSGQHSNTWRHWLKIPVTVSRCYCKYEQNAQLHIIICLNTNRSIVHIEQQMVNYVFQSIFNSEYTYTYTYYLLP